MEKVIELLMFLEEKYLTIDDLTVLLHLFVGAKARI